MPTSVSTAALRADFYSCASSFGPCPASIAAPAWTANVRQARRKVPPAKYQLNSVPEDDWPHILLMIKKFQDQGEEKVSSWVSSFLPLYTENAVRETIGSPEFRRWATTALIHDPMIAEEDEEKAWIADPEAYWKDVEKEPPSDQSEEDMESDVNNDVSSVEEELYQSGQADRSGRRRNIEFWLSLQGKVPESELIERIITEHRDK